MNRRYPLSAHLGYLFTEVPLAARFEAAARSGFRYVEHPSPYSLPAALVADLCDEHGLSVVQIALPAGGEGEKGLAAIPGREGDFARTAEIGMAYAEVIGCTLVHPMSGIPEPGFTRNVLDATYRANLELACSIAADAALDVIIEPIGAEALEGYYMNRPDFAVSVIDQLARPNLRLSFDVYHAKNAGIDPAAFARSHGSLMAHVQIADSPGRHEPGSGKIDFDELFAAFDESGYVGVIGLEYHPAASTEAGLNWTMRHRALEPLGRGIDA